jgi:hypothetical protein
MLLQYCTRNFARAILKRRQGNMIEQTNTLRAGAIIHYRLLPAERPTHPHRIWKGRVIACYLGMRYFLDCCRVVSLEKGYEELTELVLISQIVSVE